MMDITMSSSINVKPKIERRRRGEPPPFCASGNLPLRIRSSIRCSVGALGVNVEQVLAAPAVGLGIILCAALTPIRRIRHGVLRDAPQKTDFLVHLSGQLDAVY